MNAYRQDVMAERAKSRVELRLAQAAYRKAWQAKTSDPRERNALGAVDRALDRLENAERENMQLEQLGRRIEAQGAIGRSYRGSVATAGDEAT